MAVGAYSPKTVLPTPKGSSSPVVRVSSDAATTPEPLANEKTTEAEWRLKEHGRYMTTVSPLRRGELEETLVNVERWLETLNANGKGSFNMRAEAPTRGYGLITRIVVEAGPDVLAALQKEVRDRAYPAATNPARPGYYPNVPSGLSWLDSGEFKNQLVFADDRRNIAEIVFREAGSSRPRPSLNDAAHQLRTLLPDTTVEVRGDRLTVTSTVDKWLDVPPVFQGHPVDIHRTYLEVRTTTKNDFRAAFKDNFAQAGLGLVPTSTWPLELKYGERGAIDAPYVTVRPAWDGSHVLEVHSNHGAKLPELPGTFTDSNGYVWTLEKKVIPDPPPQPASDASGYPEL